jgi:transcriptional regulator with XRE-family HTH domain
VDDARIGRSLRVLRRRRGLRQIDVAALAGLSQQTISLIERGQAAAFTVDTLRRAFAAVGAGYEGLVVWRGGALDRLLDARHSALVGEAAARLTALGWAVVVEASYSIYGERGSVDVLAGHAATRTVLVEEVKSELASIEALGRKTDEKVRLARRHLCRERFGWAPIAAGKVLVLPDTDAARRAVVRHGGVLDLMFPSRPRTVRLWLRRPVGDLSGLVFVADTNPVGGNAGHRSRERVRARRAPLPQARMAPTDAAEVGPARD